MSSAAKRRPAKAGSALSRPMYTGNKAGSVKRPRISMFFWAKTNPVSHAPSTTCRENLQTAPSRRDSTADRLAPRRSTHPAAAPPPDAPPPIAGPASYPLARPEALAERLHLLLHSRGCARSGFIFLERIDAHTPARPARRSTTSPAAPAAATTGKASQSKARPQFRQQQVDLLAQASLLKAAPMASRHWA
jgi:hypothetical protein